MNRTAARAGYESGRSDGSRTLTIHDVPTPEAGGSGGAGPSRGGDSPSDGVLRLRGRGDQSDNRRVVWSEGTVDNEGLGRKKSKICCIYHKPKAFDESSDESSSGSDSDSPSSGSDSDSSPASDRDDDGPSVSKAMRDKMNGKKRDERRGSGSSHTHDNADGDACEHHDHSSRSKKSSKSSSKAKRSHKSSSSTMVITEESQESSHRHGRPPLPPDDDDDDGEDDPRPRPNAYERGPA